MQQPATWGAIFDWDGVIIDSSAHHEESWERLAREERKGLPEGHFKKGFGRRNEFIIPEILQWTNDGSEIHRLSLRKEELYREVVRDRGLVALPGVIDWLQQLQEARVPCAIGSSTHRANIDLSLGLIGLAAFFQAIVTGDEVRHGKPHPEVFLTAASRINREPAKCVVWEDAFVGIEAARAGGMKVVAVATTNPIETLGAADRAVHRLDELTVTDIAGLWQSGDLQPT